MYKEAALLARSAKVADANGWRCRVLSPGPKEYIKNFYKRSPFNSLEKKKADKYFSRGLIEIILRLLPIMSNLTAWLCLHPKNPHQTKE